MKKLVYPAILLVLFACDEYDENNIGTSDYSFSSLDCVGCYAEIDIKEGGQYNDFVENPFINVADAAVSTFSIDADGASYANVRRYIGQGTSTLPPSGAVRIEEFINYFPLDYQDTNSGHPISLNGEVSTCPWNPNHELIRIGIKGKSIEKSDLPASNIVLLIDVSGSMAYDNKLALLIEGINMMIDEFGPNDKVAIVTYAGSAGLILASTSGNEKAKIRNAIGELGAGGSTAGAQGIITAYEIAQNAFVEGGNNRVILGTDGDFNVGPSSQNELVKLIEEKRELGIFLTVIGVGTNNYNEGTMEQLANNGNGTFEYIDNTKQAEKVFVHEYHKFYSAAKDVKVQVEFNPNLVESYRLIGYENRILEEKDFKDDKKDAGEISVGQNITALYEIKPASSAPAFRSIPALTFNFRYKQPDSDTSIPIDLEIYNEGRSFSNASEHMRITASIAGFGMLLRNSKYKEDMTFDDVLNWSQNAMTYDPQGYRQEFRELVEQAKKMK